MSNENFTFNLITNGIIINSTLFTFPLEISKLAEILGNFRLKEKSSEEGNNIITWDKWGIFLYSKDAVFGDTICICFLKSYWYDGATFFPEQLFTSALKINGEEFEAYLQPIKDKLRKWGDPFKVGKNSLYISIDDDKKVTDIQFNPSVKTVKKASNKYAPKKVKGEKLHFKDFNFKLAIIQVLMYEKELLTPKFDIEEFASLYTKREIDIDSEGYDFIPEVKTYFEKLEIDKKYAEHITEIYLDGGNEIYGNVICFWDGEDTAFDIKSVEDANQFPNLKKVTVVFGINDKANIEKLEKSGIEVLDL